MRVPHEAPWPPAPNSTCNGPGSIATPGEGGPSSRCKLGEGGGGGLENRLEGLDLIFPPLPKKKRVVHRGFAKFMCETAISEVLRSFVVGPALGS